MLNEIVASAIHPSYVWAALNSLQKKWMLHTRQKPKRKRHKTLFFTNRLQLKFIAMLWKTFRSFCRYATFFGATSISVYVSSTILLHISNEFVYYFTFFASTARFLVVQELTFVILSKFLHGTVNDEIENRRKRIKSKAIRWRWNFQLSKRWSSSSLPNKTLP